MFKYLSDYTCKIKHNQISTAADDYESPLHNKTTVSLLIGNGTPAHVTPTECSSTFMQPHVLL